MIDPPNEKKIKNKKKIDININNNNNNNIQDTEDNNSEKMDEFNKDEFTKMLSHIFPSKYMNEKVNELENKKKGKVKKNIIRIDNQKEKEKNKLNKLEDELNNMKNSIE